MWAHKNTREKCRLIHLGDEYLSYAAGFNGVGNCVWHG